MSSLLQKLETLQQLLSKMIAQKPDLPLDLYQSLVQVHNECDNLTQEKMVYRERINALENMASNITHNFNNIFSPILGLTELLLSREDYIENKEKITHYLRLINSAAQEGTQTLEVLRKFYRDSLEEEIFCNIEMASLLQNLISINRKNWEELSESLVIHTNLERGVCVQGYQAGLEEAFKHIIDNAVEAMPEGGSLFVELFAKESVVVKISDSGKGMEQHNSLLCMEPFFTTKSSRNPGLGLAIAYGIIVKRHQGNIEIESKQQKGTTVLVELPMQ